MLTSDELIDIFIKIKNGYTTSTFIEVHEQMLAAGCPLAAAVIPYISKPRLAAALTAWDERGAGGWAPGRAERAEPAACGLVLIHDIQLDQLLACTTAGSALRQGYAPHLLCGWPMAAALRAACDPAAAAARARAHAGRWHDPETPPGVCGSQLDWVEYCMSACYRLTRTERAIAGLAAGELDPGLALAITLPTAYYIDAACIRATTDALVAAFDRRDYPPVVLPIVIV